MADFRFSTVMKTLCASLLVLLLAACGGGGSGDPGFVGGGIDDPGGGEDETETILSVEMTDPDGNLTTTITSSSPATLTVTATDGKLPLPNEVVNVAAVDLMLTPVSGSALTNEEGIAVFELAAGGTSGAGAATVSSGDATLEVNYEVVSVLSISLTDSAGNPITIITDDVPGIITVTVTDAEGNPQEDEVVSATTTNGSIDPATALTSEAGEALFQLSAAESSGAGTVTAQLGSDFVSINFQIISVSAGVNVLDLVLTDPDGAETTNVTSVSPGTLTVTATDPLGQPLANEILSANSSIGDIVPASGTALTDLSGVATFRLEAGSTLGAGTIVVTLGEGEQGLNFQVGEANLRIGRIDDDGDFVQGEIDAASVSLPAAGSTSLEVVVVDDDDELVTTTVAVNFSSGCASLDPPLADISAAVNTISGIATSTYTANGCVGTDIITAAIVQGNTQTATVSLEIAAADVNSISFVSAEPTDIALKGTGGEGRQETSSVKFQVLDATGAPVPGYDVALSLSTTVGGLSLTNNTATTNEDGVATAIVQAGNVSTSVRVNATIIVDGNELTTVSDRLIVSTGIPDQNSTSLSASAFNVVGMDRDGTAVTLTMRLADKFNNPVPDGTVVFFTTEYGSVEDSCETEVGQCSVTWSSQEPRQGLIYNNFGGDSYISTLDNRVCANTGASGSPCDTDGTIAGSTAVGFTQVFGGRSTVLAHAIGEESFIDSNGNGLYDVGEDFEDLGEAFIDNNENRPTGDWTAGYDGNSTCSPSDASIAGRECASGLEETFVDFNESGVYSDGNGIYNGSLCPEALESSGDCSRELVHVRRDLTIILSQGAGQRVVLINDAGGGGADTIQTAAISVTGAGNDTESFVALVGDYFNNMPAAGATITVTSDACELISTDSFTVPNTTATGPYAFGVTVGGDASNVEAVIGPVRITVTNPEGNSPQPYEILCTDEAG